jgi:hypothetical protein
MSHFAQIDENNIVQRVLVIEQAEIDTGNWGDPTSFIQTSYNTRGGVYFSPDTDTPDIDQSKSFRKNFAGPGFTWMPSGPSGEGFVPPKPYPSWIMNNSSYLWEAPTPVPIPNSPPNYEWNETTLSWEIVS